MKLTGLLSLVAALFVAVALGPHAAHADTAKPLEGKKVAVMITEGFHDGETLVPMAYLVNRGAEVTVIGIEPGEYKAYNSDITMTVEKSVTQVAPADFDLLLIPGGQSPARLRDNEYVVAWTRAYFEADGLTAAICHGPQVLVRAGVIEGRTLTCVGGISDEVTEAGGEYVDQSVVRDGNLITSRVPGDLPAFAEAIMMAMAEE